MAEIRRTRKGGFTTWGMVLRYISDHEFPLSLREIADGLNVASTSTIAHHLDHLIARGFLTKVPKCPRTLRLTDKGRKVLEK